MHQAAADRYDTMPYEKTGNSGLKLPRVSLGLWHNFGDTGRYDQMALAWVLKDGVVTSVLAGASRPSQILDNIQAVKNTSFTAEELEKIEQITNP